MYWIVPGVLAGRPGPECVPWNLGDFVESGIGGVVSLDGPIRTKELHAAGLRHLPAYQPMLLLRSDEERMRFLSVMRPALAFIDELRDLGLATLVHCYHGCDRTGAVLACYLVARRGSSASEAVRSVQKVNPDAMWAVGYMEAVYAFEDAYRSDPRRFEDRRER
jgi:hypothetical protein